MLTQLTRVYRWTCLGLGVCVCVYTHARLSAWQAFRILKSTTFHTPPALQGELQLEEIRTPLPHIKISYPSIRVGAQRKLSWWLPQQQTHAARQLWAGRPYPFFPLIQNGFLLITIIPKVLKHINRWVSPAYKGPAGWLLWPCPTAADTSFSDKSNLAVTRGLASLKKYWGWSGSLKSANAPRPYCCRDYSAVIFGCLQPTVSHLLHPCPPRADGGSGGNNLIPRFKKKIQPYLETD